MVGWVLSLLTSAIYAHMSTTWQIRKMASKWFSKGEKNSRKNSRKLIYYVCAELLQYLLLFSYPCYVCFFLMERPVKGTRFEL